MALPGGFFSWSARSGGRTRESMCHLGKSAIISRAERGIGLGDETGLVYLSPSMRPFLDAAGKLDQGGSHVFHTEGRRCG